VRGHEEDNISLIQAMAEEGPVTANRSQANPRSDAFLTVTR